MPSELRANARRPFEGLRGSVRLASGKVSVVPLLLVLVPLAVDYKGTSAGGSVVQLLLVLLVLAGFCWMLLDYRVPTDPKILSLASIAALLLPVIGGIIHVLLGEVDANRYVRVALPYLLMALGFSTAFIAMQRDQLRLATHLAVIAALASTVFTMIYAFTIVDGVQDLRHRVLSPVFAIVFVYAVRELMLAEGRTHLWVFAVTLVLVAVMLSVTRSAAITLFAGLCAVLLIHRHDIRRVRALGPLAALPVALLGFGLISVAMGRGELLSHWHQRVFTADDSLGFDLTSVTRLAEIDAQLSLWLDKGALSVLFGRGLGAEYGYSSDYDYLLRKALAASSIARQETFAAGHNFWIYSLFSGGLVFGLWLPLLIGYIGIRAAKASLRHRRSDRSVFRDGVIVGFSVLVCFVASTIGGNLLGSRFGALLYGYFFGLTVMSLGQSDEEGRPGLAALPPPRR